MTDAPSTAQESSAAPSSTAEGGDAAGGGGGSSMLIIGGVVVLLILGAAGVFVVLSGKSSGGTTTSEAADKGPGGNNGGGSTTASQNASSTEHAATTVPVPEPEPDEPKEHSTPSEDPGYHGVRLGPFENVFHGVFGYVYVANEDTFRIRQFSYDGQGPQTFFYVSNDKIDENGVRLKDENGNTEELKAYNNADIMIKLEDGKKVSEFKYFYIYCVQATTSFGHVEIPANVEIPKAMDLDINNLQSPDHMVDAIAVTLVDTITVKIKGAHVDEKFIDYVIRAGKSDHPVDDQDAIDISPSMIPPGAKTATLTLTDDDLAWPDLKWIAFFDAKTKKVEATIMLPNPEYMVIPVHPTKKGKSRRHRSKGRRTAGMSAVKVAPSKPKLLVCSYGESGVVRSMVPSDGLCDVIFYTDVTYDNDAEAIVSRDGGPAFDVLKSVAKQYTRTSFGTSMATGGIARTVRNKKSELMAAMQDLFASKLTHFGMLNVENIEDYDKLKDADLQYIKVADEFLQKKQSSLTRHRALGFSLRDGSKGPKILDAAKQVSSDFPELTMVIIKLHTENYGPEGDHWPLAPNPDDVDLSEHNALSLAAIKEDLEEPLKEISKQGKYVMLSFAMFARTYRMKKTWSGAAAREMSESSLNMDYSSVCKMKTEKDSEDTGTLYATDEHKKFLALFDSENTFRTKTNNRLSVMPRKFTGLAVYNVEMDDHKGACGKGKFVRLKAIKAALAA